MDTFKRFLGSARTFWTGLSLARRLVLVFVTTAVLLGVLAVAVVGQRVNYSTLYADLPAEDAAAIVEKLKAQQIPYLLEGSGSKILVPEERVHALRLELASGGLPRGGGVGFEIFDRSQIGATEFEQQVNLRRALEGELARSIATLEGVKSARVHLVMPERRLFAKQQGEAAASVVLSLRNPRGFGKGEVAGIVHLVSSAVPGLSPDRVSIVSTEGLTLHRPVSDAAGTAGMSTDMTLEHSQAIAEKLESRVREQLERVVGPGNADVRVAVEVDTSTRERNEEYYTPDKTALRSEHLVEESLGGPNGGVAGVPGARSNLPDAPAEAAAAPAQAGSGVARHTHTRNWEVNRYAEKTSLPPGSIQRLSVAVLINGKTEHKGGKAVFVPRSPEEVKALEGVIKQAVGFNAERGDGIHVQAAKFTREEPPPAPAEPVTDQFRRYVPWAVGGLALALLLVTSLLLLRRKKPARGAVKPALPGLAEGAALPPAEVSEAARIEAVDVRKRALELASEDPATAAVVIRKWLGAPSNTSTPALRG